MSEQRFLTYQETLELVEKFMINSGIRNFCTNVCHGGCCGYCHKYPKVSCFNNEGRRLMCSIFVCEKFKGHPVMADLKYAWKTLEPMEKEAYEKISSLLSLGTFDNPCIVVNDHEKMTGFSISEKLVMSSLPDKSTISLLKERVAQLTTTVVLNQKNNEGGEKL